MPRLYVLGRDDALDPAEVVDVAMGVDDRAHPALAAVGPVQGERRGGALGGDERVDHDHARLALHESDVGDVIAPYLVDRGHDLEQAVHPVELGDAPQAWVHRVGGVRIHESVAVHVPHGAPALVADDEPWTRRDQPTLGVLEVLVILERQAGGRLGEDSLRVRARGTRLAHSMCPGRRSLVRRCRGVGRVDCLRRAGIVRRLCQAPMTGRSTYGVRMVTRRRVRGLPEPWRRRLAQPLLAGCLPTALRSNGQGRPSVAQPRCDPPPRPARRLAASSGEALRGGVRQPGGDPAGLV